MGNGNVRRFYLGETCSIMTTVILHFSTFDTLLSSTGIAYLSYLCYQETLKKKQQTKKTFVILFGPLFWALSSSLFPVGKDSVARKLSSRPLPFILSSCSSPSGLAPQAPALGGQSYCLTNEVGWGFQDEGGDTVYRKLGTV